jgi:DNA-binding transcriptional MocR family regulator
MGVKCKTPYEQRKKQLELIQAARELTVNDVLPLARELADYMKVSIETVYHRVNLLSKITGKRYFRPMETELRVKKIQDSKNGK